MFGIWDMQFSFLWISEPKMSVLDCLEMELRFQIQIVKIFHDVNFNCFVCFGDDAHQRDARHSHHREDRRDAETAHYVCTVLFYLNSNSWNQTKYTSVHWIKDQIHHSIWQQIVTSGNGSTSPPLDERHEDCGAEGHKVCLAIANPSKDNEKSDNASLRAWISHTGP